jgi:hypothetical protein
MILNVTPSTPLQVGRLTTSSRPRADTSAVHDTSTFQIAALVLSQMS